jgi:hypothetical protein
MSAPGRRALRCFASQTNSGGRFAPFFLRGWMFVAVPGFLVAAAKNGNGLK